MKQNKRRDEDFKNLQTAVDIIAKVIIIKFSNNNHNNKISESQKSYISQLSRIVQKMRKNKEEKKSLKKKRNKFKVEERVRKLA